MASQMPGLQVQPAIVLSHYRRRVVYSNVTEHPTAWWTGQQIVQAFPEETAPRYLLRDQDQISYGQKTRAAY